MLVKVVAVQAAIGQKLSLEEKIHIFKQRPDFVCLPEYYLLDKSDTDFHRAALRRAEHIDYLQRLSDEMSTCIIGGSVVEADEDRLYNATYVFNRGVAIAGYRKQFPVAGEIRGGIGPGSGNTVFSVEGVRVGLLICGDVFHPELFGALGEADVDIIFLPTTSPYRPDDSLSQKMQRDKRYFVSGAEASGAYVVKTCAVGRLFGRPLQGRSLIAAPWGILARVDGCSEQNRRVLVVTLDMAEIREFRLRLGARKVSSTRGKIENSVAGSG